jgi:CubicO group peptidase (beta-lactamase class C family)
LVEMSLSKFTVAGVAVAIVKDGEIIHQKGYGIKSLESKEAVDEHTNFAIASNTKAFTTAALAILVEEGKLSWLDKVIDHIPEFTMYNSYVTENFNIQDLLTHRSGLGLGAGDLMLFPDGGDFTINDILTSFQYFKPESAFRTKFDYDNLLYLVAGEIIARVSGMSWERFVETRIMEPLNMDNSYTSINYIKDKSNLATPYLNDEGSLVAIESELLDPEKLNGAPGGIYSNVNDLSNWMIMHLNKGKYGDSLENELFTGASQREMWKIHTTQSASRNPRYNSHFRGYGLGWGLTDVKGNMVVSHTGGLSGMLSKTMLVPDLNLGVVVLTNTYIDGAGIFLAVTQTILDRYLELDEFDWVDVYYEGFQANQNEADSVVDHVWATVKSADASKLAMKNYVGIYEDSWFGKVEIYAKDKQLYFKSLRSPKLSGPMALYKPNEFAIKWTHPNMEADAFAIFSLDEEGKAEGIKMKGISPDIDFSYDFQDLDLKRVGK